MNLAGSKSTNQKKACICLVRTPKVAQKMEPSGDAYSGEPWWRQNEVLRATFFCGSESKARQWACFTVVVYT